MDIFVYKYMFIYFYIFVLYLYYLYTSSSEYNPERRQDNSSRERITLGYLQGTHPLCPRACSITQRLSTHGALASVRRRVVHQWATSKLLGSNGP